MRYCHFPGDHKDRPYDSPEPAAAAMTQAKVGANLVFARFAEFSSALILFLP